MQIATAIFNAMEIFGMQIKIKCFVRPSLGESIEKYCLENYGSNQIVK